MAVHLFSDFVNFTSTKVCDIQAIYKIRLTCQRLGVFTFLSFWCFDLALLRMQY